MVTQERSIENESQVRTPTNYDQRIEIQNTKSKLRAEKNKSSSIRTTVANFDNAQIEDPVVTVPGNRSCSSTTKLDKIYVKDIVKRILNIGKCLSYGVKQVIISSIFIKKHLKLTRIMRQV